MFCRNCGTDIGENKFCSHCGTASTPQSNIVSGHSTYYHQICDYAREVDSFFVFGLLSLIFCMGIGLIFEIICYVKSIQMKKHKVILEKGFTLPNYPEEWEKLKSAQAKHKSGYIMFAIGYAITATSMFILGVIAFINGIS